MTARDADDLLARAKEFYERGTKLTDGIVLVDELADELERLRAEADKWRVAAEALAAAVPGLDADEFAAKYFPAGGDQPTSPTDSPPCPACNGDGESDESPLVPCPACLGTGRPAPTEGQP